MSFGTIDLKYLGHQGVVKFDTDNLSQSVLDFGEAKAAQALNQTLSIHESIMRELQDELSQRTTDYQAVYGVDVTGIKMIRGNEYSNPLVQRPDFKGVTVGFRLEKSELAVQWTRRALSRMSLSEFNLIVRNVLIADIKDFREQLMKAIFSPLNDTDWKDYMVDYREFPVYALLNGDGKLIPSAPDGQTFDGTTHSHYQYATELTEQVVRDTLNNVSEHGVTGDLKLYIPRSFENAIWAMKASGAFAPYQKDPQIAPNPNEGGYVIGKYLSNDPNNRVIGWFDGNEVVVRSWVPTKYILAVDTGNVGDKALAYRVDEKGYGDGLSLQFENESYPLIADVFDRLYGLSAWQRHKIAITYIDQNATEYVAPTVYPQLLK